VLSSIKEHDLARLHATCRGDNATSEITCWNGTFLR
jgi:hypothetical protein